MALDDMLVAGSSDEAPDAAGVYRIWPGDGVPPGSEGWDWSERAAAVPWAATGQRYVRNVVVPTVTVHRPPPGKANGTALVVAPGGAFHFLMVEHEGHDMARWLAARGVALFVLHYRLARTPDDDGAMIAFRTELQARLEQPARDETEPPRREFLREVRLMSEEDGRQAIRFVRSHAAEWGIDPQRIGICGFSAGGGVAMGPAMEHDGESRPDFAVAVYPAYRGDLGMPAEPPPLFLVIADNDQSIAPISAARLYERWHKAGAPVELHVFGDGAHGFGMNRPGRLSDIWTVLLENWLKARGLL